MCVSPEGSEALPRVVVIGGGILGVLSAFELASRGASVIVLEGSGALGGLGRSLELGGIEFDIGVRILPAAHADGMGLVSRATKGAVRLVPMAERARVNNGVDTPANALVQTMPLLRRVEVAIRRLSQGHPAGDSLGDVGRHRLTATVWDQVMAPLARRTLGESAEHESFDENRSFGLFGQRLDRGVKSLKRGLIDVFAPVVRRPSAGDHVQLGDPDTWRIPSEPYQAVPGYGLYPSSGPFNAIVGNAAAHTQEMSGVDVRTNHSVSDMRFEGGRLAAVFAGGEWFSGDAFVFSAGVERVLGVVGARIPRLRFRTFVQTALLLDQPPPDWLYEVVYQPSIAARVFFPQRFQGLKDVSKGVFVAESWCDPRDASGYASLDGEGQRRRGQEVLDDMKRIGVASRGASLLESRTDVVANALMVFPSGWFRELGAGVDLVRREMANVHFTGMAATFAPITPAGAAIAKIPGMVTEILRS